MYQTARILRDGGCVVGFSTSNIARAEVDRAAIAASKAGLQALVLAATNE